MDVEGVYHVCLTCPQIDDDLVLRQLIITQQIEQTLLIENREKAVELLNRSRLPNAKQCFTMNTRAGEGLRLAYGYNGTVGSNYIPAFRGTPRMGTDIEYQIK